MSYFGGPCDSDQTGLSRGLRIHTFTNNHVYINIAFGAIQVLHNVDGGGSVRFSGKKRYEGVRCNVITITRGWVVQFPEKKLE